MIHYSIKLPVFRYFDFEVPVCLQSPIFSIRCCTVSRSTPVNGVTQQRSDAVTLRFSLFGVGVTWNVLYILYIYYIYYNIYNIYIKSRSLCTPSKNLMSLRSCVTASLRENLNFNISKVFWKKLAYVLKILYLCSVK